MRWDLTGVLWDDYVPPKVKKEKVFRVKPDPVWERPDYLPNLEEARAYKFDVMSGHELYVDVMAGDRFIWDWEFYPNYVVGGAKNMRTGKLVIWEMHDDQHLVQGRDMLDWFTRNAQVIGFNDQQFDIPMVHAILAGYGTEQLMQFVNLLILGDENGQSVNAKKFYKKTGVPEFPVNSIDLIEVNPSAPGLKILAGRIHAARMADLPFKAGSYLTDDQKTILKYYWVNDLDNTQHLYEKHKTAIELREILTAEYGVDVRSKSDPQIAEAVIRAEMTRLTGQKYFKRAEIEAGRSFKYVPPRYVRFNTPTMQWVMNLIPYLDFVVAMDGSPTMPDKLAGLDIPIGGSVYRMGIGGLHSKEKKAVHVAGDRYELSDNDVVSYYPSLIIQQGMYPPNIGPAFLEVFTKLVHRRIAAKKAGDKATAETLKIVANGTFGKTGERGGWSVVYYPEMMIQVTLSGQLSLLMLIEALELEGISVISANTDGIVVKCPVELIERKKEIMREWEATTGLELEHKNYKAIYSRDVNNYVALYEKPDDKEKGAFRFAKAIGAYRKTLDAYPMKWNPTCDICSEAVIQYLYDGTPIEETIGLEKDIRKFIEVRRVNGGACKDGEYFGKAVRWYYAKGIEDEIINAKNGHSVPRSLGARPCMTLPKQIPDDLDFEYYFERAHDILKDLAA
ncbi:DNA polymerase protein [Rhizobium phage RHph_X3_2]|nr:DNA polymerase protein [Rhizobium phage RHph_X3_2]